MELEGGCGGLVWNVCPQGLRGKSEGDCVCLSGAESADLSVSSLCLHFTVLVYDRSRLYYLFRIYAVAQNLTFQLSTHRRWHSGSTRKHLDYVPLEALAMSICEYIKRELHLAVPARICLIARQFSRERIRHPSTATLPDRVHLPIDAKEFCSWLPLITFSLFLVCRIMALVVIAPSFLFSHTHVELSL
jgi:hypothetical protein